MRLVRNLAVAVGLAASCAASATDDPKAVLDPAVSSLLDAARATAPEFAIDIIRRILDSKFAPDPEARARLIEEGFELSARLQHPYRIVSIDPQSDSRPGRLSNALASGLDRLTIQSRLTQLKLQEDPERGFALFSRIPPPNLLPRDCRATAMPDPSPYFATATAVAQLGFSPEQKEENEDHRLLVQVLRGVHSTLELTPAAHMILAAESSPDQRIELIEEYVIAMGRIEDGDRELATAADRMDLGTALADLALAAKASGASELPLINAARAFLVERLSGTRCRDNVESKRIDRSLDRLITALSQFVGPDGEPLFEPLSEEERTPVYIEKSADVGLYWRTDASKALLTAAKRLRFGEDGNYRSTEDKLGADWQLKAFDYLVQLAGWEPDSGDDPIEHFHIKAGLFKNLVDLAPDDELRRSAVRENLKFLANSQVQRDDPVQFLWQLHSLLDLARELRGDQKQRVEERQKRGVRIPGLPNGSRDLIFEEMRNSRNAVIALYIAAEETLPLGHGEWARR